MEEHTLFKHTHFHVGIKLHADTKYHDAHPILQNNLYLTAKHSIAVSPQLQGWDSSHSIREL